MSTQQQSESTKMAAPKPKDAPKPQAPKRPAEEAPVRDPYDNMPFTD